MEWLPTFKEFFAPLIYIALVSVFWNRFREEPKEKAEKNARSGALVSFFFAGALFVVVIILSFVDRDHFIGNLGQRNIWTGIGLSICMLIAGIGIWLKKRWGIIWSFILTPIVLSCIVGLIGIQPGEFIATTYLLLVSIFFLSDLRSLWNHWQV